MDHPLYSSRCPPTSSPLTPHSSLGSPTNSPEKEAGRFSGGRPPGGHSRLSSADSGIQVDSGWDSLTRSHSRVVANDSTKAPEPQISQKSVYSYQSQAPSLSNQTKSKVQSTPNLSTDSQIKPTSPHTQPKPAVHTSARGMASSDDVRGMTSDHHVSVTSGGTKSKPVSKKSGMSRLINIKFLGSRSTSQDGGRRETEVKKVSTKMSSSSENVKNVTPQMLKKGVVATIELAEFQSEPKGSRIVRLSSVPQEGQSPASVSEPSTATSTPSSLYAVSVSKPSEMCSSPSKSMEVGLSSSCRFVSPGQASADRMPRTDSQPCPPQFGSASTSSVFSGSRGSEASTSSPLTLLSSTTRVIPTLPSSGSGAALPQRGDQGVVGGRGMISTQSVKEPVQSSDRLRGVSSSSDASRNIPVTQRGVKVSQNNPPSNTTLPAGASQRSSPKVLSVPVQFVKKISNDRVKNLTSPTDQRDGLAAAAEKSPVSSGGHLTLKEKSHDSHWSGSLPSQRQQSSSVGTPVQSVPRLVIPTVNACPSASTISKAGPMHPGMSPPPHLMTLSPSGSPQQQLLSVTSSPQVRSTAPPIFRSKLSPIIPQNVHRLRLPVTLSPAPSPVQPIAVKHVTHASGANFKTGSAPLAFNNQSKSPVVSKGAVTSTSPVMTSSPPAVLLKLLEMTAVVKGKGEGGERNGVERRIPVLDVRKKVPWTEQRKRMDSALSWLKEELHSLRAMDSELMTQFRRCQETIESLKQQQQWGEGEGGEWGWGWGLEGSEVDEEEGAWEDWEIAEFEKKWAAHPDGKQEVTDSDVNENDVTSSDTTSPTREQSSSPFLQDVEASV